MFVSYMIFPQFLYFFVSYMIFPRFLLTSFPHPLWASESIGFTKGVLERQRKKYDSHNFITQSWTE